MWAVGRFDAQEEAVTVPSAENVVICGRKLDVAFRVNNDPILIHVGVGQRIIVAGKTVIW